MCYFVALLISGILCAQSEPWTCTFTHFLKPQEDAIFLHEEVPLFKQLIFSWHAQRPRQGYFQFFVRVRDAHTKKWLSWHKACEWGAQRQQSFLEKTPTDDYVHVRLEMKKNYADAYQIKVQPFRASLSLLKSISACISRFDAMVPEQASNYRHLPSTRIKGIPKISQMALDHPDHDSLCSPTSLTMMISFLLRKKIDPIAVANAVYDDGLRVYGSWPFNIAYANELAHNHYFFVLTRLHSFKQLHEQLILKRPVVVSVRGSLRGAPKSYPGGHLMVIIGYDAAKQRVICHDPAVEPADKVLKQYPLSDFLFAWERSHRLAYIARG